MALGNAAKVWRQKLEAIPNQTSSDRFVDQNVQLVILLSTNSVRISIIHLSSFIFHLSSSILHPSSFILHPSSFIHIHHPSSIIHHPSFIIHHSSSIIHHPSSIIHHPSSIIHHSSSIIHHPSSTIHHPPSIILRRKHGPCLDCKQNGCRYLQRRVDQRGQSVRLREPKKERFWRHQREMFLFSRPRR